MKKNLLLLGITLTVPAMLCANNISETRRHPIPQVWQLPGDAGRFTRLNAFPADWQAYKRELRQRMWKIFGTAYDRKLPLNCRVINTLEHEDVTLKNIIYQSRPGIYVTATLYIPDGKAPFPAVISLQGHWSEGRLAEKIQYICMTIAKSGYVVLSIDAFGQGERSTVHGDFEYHGKNLGAQFYQIGETLAGAQLVDNMRGVDLLSSLPEVDNKRIGATGGSGGGNQTLYLAAMDDRIKAAVPVCNTGSYESFLDGVNCICETLPDALTFTELGGVLALTAPRALLLCNGLHDVPVFSPHEMLRSYNAAKQIYSKLGVPENIAHRIFNHGHTYNRPTREAMLGWFALHLKGTGVGNDITEPCVSYFDREKLMMFSKGKRPAEVIPIATYVRKKGAELLAGHRKQSAVCRKQKTAELKKVLKLDNNFKLASFCELPEIDRWRRFQLELANGRCLPLVLRDNPGDITVVTHINGKEKIPYAVIDALLAQGRCVAALDLTGNGELGPKEPPEKVMAYHQTARRELWQGRNLSGIWCSEIIAAIETLKQLHPGKKISLYGFKETAVSSLWASIFVPGLSEVTLVDAPVSFLFKKQTPFYSMAYFIPGILKWGDIPLAAALSEAKLNWITPRFQDGSPAEIPEKEINFWRNKLK